MNHFFFANYFFNCQEQLLVFNMRFLMEITLLVCLFCKLNCLEIRSCNPSQKIFISPQYTPLVISCETDTALGECTLKKSSHPYQKCTYHYKQHTVNWYWEIKSCPVQNIVSKSKSYTHCEFSLTSISLSGKRWLC
jgi:hypothetical protein